MPENIFWDNSHNLEAEIAELSRQISVKRKQLESERGVVSDHEVISETITENFVSNEQTTSTEQVGVDLAATGVTPVVAKSVAGDQSYLDTLDDQSVAVVNNLIALVPIKGIKQAINQALTHSPFILDAFHDALVDKLYDELKSRGLIS